jgi:hypothetical protein
LPAIAPPAAATVIAVLLLLVLSDLTSAAALVDCARANLLKSHVLAESVSKINSIDDFWHLTHCACSCGSSKTTKCIPEDGRYCRMVPIEYEVAAVEEEEEEAEEE